MTSKLPSLGFPAWIVLLGLVGSSGAARAMAPQEQQPASEADTRAGELEAKRRSRLAEVEPAKPSKIVNILTTAENDGFDQLITWQVNHFRVGFGKISPVSGLTPGIQYERPRIGATPLTLRTAAAYSLRGYQAYEFQIGEFDYVAPDDALGDGFLGAPFVWDNRSQELPERFLYFETRYTDQPQEVFYGLGNDSSPDQRTDFAMQQAMFHGVGGFQFTRWAGFQAKGGFFTVDVTEGRDDNLTDTVDVFDDTTAPGIDSQPDFLYFDTGLYFAWEGDPNLPSAGVGLRFARASDLEQDLYRFNRYSFDARAVLPLGSRQRAFAFRAFTSRDEADEGSTVPFYLMRTLGGHDTLRGFRDFRFRDTRVLYFSGEYRWEATAGLGLAFFYDTGKVFSDSSDFNLDDLKESYGVGIRGRVMWRVVFRLDVGHSTEGTYAYLAFGPAF